MEIKDVISNEGYQNKYVAINNSVYTAERAVQFFPKHKEAISKVLNNNLKQIDELFPVITSPLPTNNEIIKLIEKERDNIFRQLKLKTVASQDEKQKQAYKLFCYISKNFNYDMMVKEEVNNANKTDNYDQNLSIFKEKISFLQMLNDFYQTQNDIEKKEDLKKFCDIRQEEAEKIANKVYEENTKLFNNSLFNSIYKVLIEKRGICGHAAYTYAYLLKCLDIDSNIITISIKDEGDEFLHSLILLETMQNGKKFYYGVDLVKGNSSYNETKQFAKEQSEYYSSGFLLTEKDLSNLFGNYEITHLEKLNNSVISPKESEEVTPYLKHYYNKDNNLQKLKAQMITKENQIDTSTDKIL